jgi:hypothetical protein
MSSNTKQGKGFKWLPWGGVAVKLQPKGHNVELNPKPPIGRAYCFLPLPIETGLPCHVNGYFEISYNRKDIWGADQVTKYTCCMDIIQHFRDPTGQLRADWNELLLKEVLVPSYVHIILAVKDRVVERTNSSFYSLFPRDKPRFSTVSTKLNNSVLLIGTCSSESFIYKLESILSFQELDQRN